MTEYITPQEKRIVDSLREFLRKQGKGKSCVRGGENLFEKAGKEVLSKENSRIGVRALGKAFKWLIDHDEIKVKTWVADPGYPGKGNITLNLKHLPLKPYEILWIKAVQESPFSEQNKGTLSQPELAEKLKDFSFSGMGRVLDCLYTFRDNPSPAGESLYNVSAQNFLGSSKLLDHISAHILAKIGIDSTIYPGPPKYIIVAGNPNPRSVILVENPHSFEAAVRADKNLEHTWISAYGFGLSLDKSKEYGKLMVNNLTDHRESLISLTRNGSPEDLTKLLESPNLMFWGDLDMAGMLIYSNLKKSFPNVKLSALYQPMLEHLRNGTAHPYVKAVGKEGQRLFKSNCKMVTGILAECREVAVDQEVVTGEQVIMFVNQGELSYGEI